MLGNSAFPCTLSMITPDKDDDFNFEQFPTHKRRMRFWLIDQTMGYSMAPIRDRVQEVLSRCILLYQTS